MDPDRPATEEMAHLPPQGFDQLPRFCRIKTDHVNNNVRVEAAHARSERTGRIFRLAVHDDVLHFPPCWIGQVGLAASPVDANYLVAFVNQSRNEKRAHVTRSTNHYNTHLCPPL